MKNKKRQMNEMNEQNVTQVSTDTLCTVRLSPVRGYHEWPTDATQNEQMAEILRQGKSLGTPILWRVPDTDTYEVIDGFHRMNALELAVVEEFSATVRDCDARTAEMDRIQACIGKSDELLRTRAVKVLRTRFVTDIAAFIEDKELLAFELMPEYPGRKVVKREGPLPEDPLTALMVFYNHYQAVQYQRMFSEEPREKSRQATTENSWEQQVISSLQRLAVAFGKNNVEWVKKLLGIEMISDVHTEAMWNATMSVGDEQVQQLLIGRLRAGGYINTTDYRRILEYLGDNVAKPVISKHGASFTRSRAEVLSMLSAHTLSHLLHLRNRQERDNSLRQQAQQATTQKATPQTVLEQESTREDAFDRAYGSSNQLSNDSFNGSPHSAVFATVSSNWVKPHAPIASVASLATQISYEPFRLTLLSLLHQGKIYESQGGSWDSETIQKDLLKLREWLDERLKEVKDSSGAA